MSIDKRDILATSVRTIEELKRRYDLQDDKKDTGLEEIFPLSIAKGGTGATTAEAALLSLSNHSISTSTIDGIQHLDMTADVVLVSTSGGAGYLITNTNEIIGGLLVDGYEVALKPQLIWSNASPTSSFAAQTISLDLSTYNYVYIENCYMSGANNYLCRRTELFPKNCTGTMLNGSFFTWLSSRRATIDDSGITFSNGKYAYVGDTGQGEGANYCIPIKIYGVNI